MDVILITLGVLGMGAILISTYVFMVAARTYVSDDPEQLKTAGGGRERIKRNGTDRRDGHPVTFPLMVNGIMIEKDRRMLPDCRRAAA